MENPLFAALHKTDMPLFQNTLDFQNSQSATLDICSFIDVLLEFLETFE